MRSEKSADSTTGCFDMIMTGSSLNLIDRESLVRLDHTRRSTGMKEISFLPMFLKDNPYFQLCQDITASQ
ncbi:MAG: hypothetical protein LZF86_210108 [Nitrospira sp.]|jgi:hypothetical protein|nr:MAG: hypothetical protein LZF86_210108 [Nitrospira sp.]